VAADEPCAAVRSAGLPVCASSSHCRSRARGCRRAPSHRAGVLAPLRLRATLGRGGLRRPRPVPRGRVCEAAAWRCKRRPTRRRAAPGRCCRTGAPAARARAAHAARVRAPALVRAVVPTHPAPGPPVRVQDGDAAGTARGDDRGVRCERDRGLAGSSRHGMPSSVRGPLVGRPPSSARSLSTCSESSASRPPRPASNPSRCAARATRGTLVPSSAATAEADVALSTSRAQRPASRRTMSQ